MRAHIVSFAVARSLEWIVKPPANTCYDACGGVTLRKLTPADRSASRLATAIEACTTCKWAWAGFGGLVFGKDGQLKTPWGTGHWGAPPEAQEGKQQRGERGSAASCWQLMTTKH